uniref:Uncharacterized protein n=1 Tax=Chrysotila carterae TaxID=13221 RepID=A0A7S4F5N4_CHRCT|mmetsp:Transcript_11359/g.24295  ORF Transcript_11359/g.24295 Transcript_11359/m.24295 type:complete len:190 (+) Transcript_11359:131-700(+)
MRAQQLFLACTALCASALKLPSSHAPTAGAMGRRQLFTYLVPASTAAAVLLQSDGANAATARTGLASVFTGEYEDPKHPGCLRSIKVVGAQMGPDGRRQRQPTALVKGVDSGCDAEPDLASVWKLQGKVSEDGESIFIDFSPKGGPKNLIGKWDTFGSPGIVFPDGNKWTKVEGGTPERRPATPTLTSD